MTYLHYMGVNTVNKDGTLVCSQKKMIGRTYLNVCGRGCIKINNRIWTQCEHTKSKIIRNYNIKLLLQ